NAGTVTIGLGTTLTVTGNYTQTNGTTNLNGATLSATSVMIQGGSLIASGTINGNVSNGGTLDLGSPFSPGDTPGTLTVNGNYVQTSTGTLDIKIGGTMPGEQFDQLIVNGNATLGGTLNVRLIYSYTPPSGTLFQILVTDASHTVSGTFSTRNMGGRFVDP